MKKVRIFIDIPTETYNQMKKEFGSLEAISSFIYKVIMNKEIKDK